VPKKWKGRDVGGTLIEFGSVPIRRIHRPIFGPCIRSGIVDHTCVGVAASKKTKVGNNLWHFVSAEMRLALCAPPKLSRDSGASYP